MRVLVIPDIHLKPWIFDLAEEILKEGKADRAVCLMDVPDDWDMELNIFPFCTVRIFKVFPRRIGLGRVYVNPTSISILRGRAGFYFFCAQYEVIKAAYSSAFSPGTSETSFFAITQGATNTPANTEITILRNIKNKVIGIDPVPPPVA